MRRILSATLTAGLLLSCQMGKSSNSESHKAVAEESQKLYAPFDADSAYRYVREQVAFGPRTPGSTAHRACGDWIVDKLKAWGLEVVEQGFDGKDYYGKPIRGRNIIASLLPEKSQRILLMAHWDTRQVGDEDPDTQKQGQAIDGADDGASGVAVLIELARQWSEHDPSVGIDFVFFDLEDGGHSGDNDSWCLGSQYWASHPHVSGYRAQGGILLDMVGARAARFHWESYSKAYAAPLLMDLWEIARSLGHSQYFVQSDGGTMVDDHVPVIEKLGIPCVDIINYSTDGGRQGFGSHWHTHEDKLSIIDKATLQAVGQTVAHYIHKQ